MKRTPIACKIKLCNPRRFDCFGFETNLGRTQNIQQYRVKHTPVKYVYGLFSAQLDTHAHIYIYFQVFNNNLTIELTFRIIISGEPLNGEPEAKLVARLQSFYNYELLFSMSFEFRYLYGEL